MQSIRLESGLGGVYTSYICKADNKEWKEKRELLRLIMLLAKIFKVSMITITMVFVEEYSDDYDWSNYENPCKPQYYSKQNFAIQSIYQIQPCTHCKGNDQGNYLPQLQIFSQLNPNQVQQ